MYVFPVYFRGLMERVDEMRYANFANPEQRQEAYQAIRNRIQIPLPQQQVPFPRQPLRTSTTPNPTTPNPTTSTSATSSSTTLHTTTSTSTRSYTTSAA